MRYAAASAASQWLIPPACESHPCASSARECVCAPTCVCVCVCLNAFNGRSIVSRPVCFPIATQPRGHLIWSSRGQITPHQWTVVFKPTRPRWSFTERAIFRSGPQDRNKSRASTKGGSFVFALVLLWELYLYSRETNVTTSLSARHERFVLILYFVYAPLPLPTPRPLQAPTVLSLGRIHWVLSNSRRTASMETEVSTRRSRMKTLSIKKE